MSLSKTKRCLQCGKRKSINQFYVKRKATGERLSRCKRCHNNWCLANYYAKHGEKKEANCTAQKARYEKNPEKYRSRRRQWRRENPELARERDKEYDARRAEKRKAYRAANQAKRAAYNSAWKKANKDKVRVQNHRRWARLRGAEGSFTERDWLALKARHGNRCLRCRRKEPGIVLTPDHVVPLSAGGPNRIDNIQPLCLGCNLMKGTKTTDYRPTE